MSRNDNKNMDISQLKQSLKRRSDFFIEFEEDFYTYFDKVVDEYSFSQEIKSKIKAVKNKIYNRVFLSQKENKEDLYNFSYTLAKDNIDIRDILKKVFVYSIRQFSDFLLKTKPSVKDVFFLTALLNEYISVVEQAYLDYEKLQEDEEVVKTGTGREKYEEEYILQILNEHAGSTITAISYYKEVPIIFKTKIKKTTDKFIILDISKTSINVARLNKPIFLKAPFLEKPVKARVLSVDFSRNIMALESPRFSDIPAEKRKHIRIELAEPTKVIVRKGNEETMGLIVDISAGGIKFYTGDLKDLKEGEEIELIFTLANHNIKTKGEIKHINKAGKGYMVGVQIFPDLKSENIISDFVMAKQFEILKELRI